MWMVPLGLARTALTKVASSPFKWASRVDAGARFVADFDPEKSPPRPEAIEAHYRVCGCVSDVGRCGRCQHPIREEAL